MTLIVNLENMQNISHIGHDSCDDNQISENKYNYIILYINVILM